MKQLILVPFLTHTLAWFPADYSESRLKFRNNYPDYKSYIVPSKVDKDLTIDYVYHKNEIKSKKLLIINTGIHGPEGYIGGAALELFKESFYHKLQGQNVDMLLIHAMNPYGFKYSRRFTENNVDLNRNQVIEPSIFKKENEAYTNLKSMLTPEKKVNSIRGSYYNIFRKIISMLFSGTKLQEIREATAKGQYHDQEGIFFGGSELEPNSKFIQDLLKRVTRDREDILLLDFHTGLGDRSKLHLIQTSFKNDESKKFLEDLFPESNDYLVTTPDSPGFYKADGDLLDFLTQTSPEKSRVISLAAEFGTIGRGVFSQISTINRVILENQGHFHGYENDKIQADVQLYFMDLFNPRDYSWQAKVLERTYKMFSGPVMKWATKK